MFVCLPDLAADRQRNRIPARRPRGWQSVLPARQRSLRAWYHNPHLQSRLCRMGRSFLATTWWATALLDRLVHRARHHPDRRFKLPAATARRSHTRAHPLQTRISSLIPADAAGHPKMSARSPPSPLIAHSDEVGRGFLSAGGRLYLLKPAGHSDACGDHLVGRVLVSASASVQLTVSPSSFSTLGVGFAKAFSLESEPTGVVDNAIENGIGDGRISEDFVPVLDEVTRRRSIG